MGGLRCKRLKKFLDLYKNMPVQIKASFFFLMCSFLQKGVAIITTPVFTRILTTTEYGQFSVFNSWMQIITPIVSMNLYSGVYSQGVVKFDQDRNKYSSSLQGLSLTLISFWTIIYLLFHDFWNSIFSLTVVQMLSMFVMIWVGGSFNFWSMDQRVDFKYKKLVTLTLLISVVQPVVGILLVLNSEDKVTARILGMAVVQLIFYVGTFALQMIKGKTFFSKKYWKYALKFNLPLLPHYLSLTVLSSSDRIMISNMVGDDKAGIYNLAYSISLIMTMFNTALLQTIEPWIYRKLKANKIKDISRIAYPAFGLVAAVNIILIIFAPEIISLFAPAEYAEAIWVIPSVALSVYFMFLYTFFATFEFYYEKTNYVAAATVGGAILNIILNYICIGQFGYVAAGYTTLFSYILFAILHYCFMRKICKEYLNDVRPYNLKLIVSISIASLVIGFLFMMTYKVFITRYCLIAVLVILGFLMRNKILNMIKLFVNIKKQKRN